MGFETVGFSTARIEFHKKNEDGCYEVRRDCSMGCRCRADLSKSGVPTLQQACDDVLCFNDASRIGISGRGCAGKVVLDGPEVWVFEVEARLERKAAAREDKKVAAAIYPPATEEPEEEA